MDFTWIFNGENGRFASAVFTELSLAEDWVRTHKLTGVLTKYPINTGVYDWAVKEGMFNVKKEEHTSSLFIGKFTSAGQEHYHYENGERA
ncbi:MAG: hypothetical protein JO154_11280 [Chitinophaga sp.]|uniref:DUF7710 domain-containing protein n=1 Tax=Chitinophaga sp. TaxID=1869181 RepID=UPI0025C1F2F3|nr:hypothetical protein [Chitinophaga sp.]MBV8253178.1 hypothetical protein [Chitinophaga sp.]